MENISIGINLKSLSATFKVYSGYVNFFLKKSKPNISITMPHNNIHYSLHVKEQKKKSDLAISEDTHSINFRVAVI